MSPTCFALRWTATVTAIPLAAVSIPFQTQQIWEKIAAYFDTNTYSYEGAMQQHPAQFVGTKRSYIVVISMFTCQGRNWWIQIVGGCLTRLRHRQERELNEAFQRASKKLEKISLSGSFAERTRLDIQRLESRKMVFLCKPKMEGEVSQIENELKRLSLRLRFLEDKV